MNLHYYSKISYYFERSNQIVKQTRNLFLKIVYLQIQLIIITIMYSTTIDTNMFWFLHITYRFEIKSWVHNSIMYIL